jgi:hypothetical protein
MLHAIRPHVTHGSNEGGDGEAGSWAESEAVFHALVGRNRVRTRCSHGRLCMITTYNNALPTVLRTPTPPGRMNRIRTMPFMPPFQGLDLFATLPRALPWAFMSRAVGAETQDVGTGSNTAPPRPTRIKTSVGAPRRFPLRECQAHPTAARQILHRAKGSRCTRRPAPQGRIMPAQGNALGKCPQKFKSPERAA